jgi:hypothetical protein
MKMPNLPKKMIRLNETGPGVLKGAFKYKMAIISMKLIEINTHNQDVKKRDALLETVLVMVCACGLRIAFLAPHCCLGVCATLQCCMC